jgi:hypothetical protein
MRKRILIFKLSLVIAVAAVFLVRGYQSRILPIQPRPTALLLPPPIVHDSASNTPDHGSRDSEGISLFLNASLEIYNSRLGGVQEPTDRLVFRLDYFNGEPHPMHRASFYGVNHDARWIFVVAFPWPIEPVQFPVRYPINDAMYSREAFSMSSGSPSPAGAEFREYAEEQDREYPRIPSDPNYSAVCWHYVDGYITLLSTDPLVGEFQFFCQFDSTDYAQVSGRFWE